MFLHFSDWSMFLESLDKKGVPHGENIFKAYVCKEDPRIKLSMPKLFVMESSGDPFRKDEIFTYQNRKSFTGPELEKKLNDYNLSTTAKEHLRALFRFSNQPEIQSCQYMMSIKKPDGRWMFDHPFMDIDGVDMAIRNPEKRSNSLHIDIFSETSLARLKRIFDYNQKELLVPYGRELMKLIMPEVNHVLEGTPRRVEF